MSETSCRPLPSNADGTLFPLPTSRSPSPKPSRPRHFIAETLRKQGASLSFCARRLGLSAAEARAQADPNADLTLSQLSAWSEVLDVPLSELVPIDDVLPDPVRNRALLLRIFKTARRLQELSRGGKLEFAVESLFDQLVELAPEFRDVPPWPTVGQSHAARPEGAAVERVDVEFSRFIEERS